MSGGRMAFTALTAIICVPLWFVMLFTNNLVALVASNIVLYALAILWVGPATADVVEMVKPNLRGLAIGIFFSFINIAAYLIGSPLIGKISDQLGVATNPEQMRYSLLVGPAACALGAEALAGRALLVRARRPGDRLRPTGMNGSKKLHDLFVDAKVPQDARSTIPVLACGDEVVWVPGSRVSQHFAVPAPDAPSIRITARLLAPESGAPANRGLQGSSGREGKTGSQPKRRPGR
jgi:tRNA(Ile)-lysidine synthetase-like protein